VSASPPGDSYRSWLRGELVLIAVLALATWLLWAADRLEGYALPEGRLALDTTVAVVASIVAVLTAVRALVDGRLMDVLLSAGFLATALGAFAFDVAPAIGVDSITSEETWAWLGAAIVAAALIAVAPFTDRRLADRRRAVVIAWAAVAVGLVLVWVVVRVSEVAPVYPDSDSPLVVGLAVAYALLAALALVAAIGFGLRYRRFGRDLDSWLTLALTLVVFADLHYILAPTVASRDLLQGDFLRLLSFVVLLVGVWRAIAQAELGRAVAEERGRVAQEIHDGLAQYLFAISTHVSMLESGAPLETTLPKLKQASTAAQEEARFAVLALSSASGTAPFGAALRRYIEVLTADGALDVDVTIDRAVTLAPDEQIQLFRIVQEGLANARRHAGARRAWVTIAHQGGRRVVSVRDDGTGFETGDTPAAGQGLKSMRRRAAEIDGGFTLRSSRDGGTAIEIVLRAA
jgi:two-component system nitrate/nitrite sensor histidine kinase NarX